MTPLEKRLENLKELLAVEEAALKVNDPSASKFYIDDLKESIEICEANLKVENKAGYVMVK